MSLGASTEIASQGLSVSKGIEDSLLDADSVILKTHVSQHHNGREKEGSWVGKSLASDIWSGAVDSLEDRALITNVGGWSKTKTTDETSAHIGENITVQVWHNKDLVVVWGWVGDNLQAGVVNELSIELGGWEILGNTLCGVEEKTVRHLHDGGLVNSADLCAANVLGVLESVSADTFGGLTGDQLDGLNDTIDNNVLNARVLSLSVLTDEDSVDTIVWGLVASNGAAWTNVGEEVECAAEGKVEGDVALANWGSERTLEGDLVALNGLDGLVWDNSFALWSETWSNINWLPLDWGTGCLEDVLDGLGDLWTNSITLNQRDSVEALD